MCAHVIIWKCYVPVQIHFMVQLKCLAEVFMFTVQRSCSGGTCTMFVPLIFPVEKDKQIDFSINTYNCVKFKVSWTDWQTEKRKTYQNPVDDGLSKSGQLFIMSGSRSWKNTHPRTDLFLSFIVPTGEMEEKITNLSSLLLWCQILLSQFCVLWMKEFFYSEELNILQFLLCPANFDWCLPMSICSFSMNINDYRSKTCCRKNINGIYILQPDMKDILRAHLDFRSVEMPRWIAVNPFIRPGKQNNISNLTWSLTHRTGKKRLWNND